MTYRSAWLLGVGCLLIGVVISLEVAEAGEEPIRPGDKVVTTTEAAVKVGTRTLATVPSHTELTAKAVRGDWVAVTIQQDGKDISGWVHIQQLARNDVIEPAETVGGATLPWAGGGLPYASAGPMGIVKAGDSAFTVELGALKFSGVTVSVGGPTPESTDGDSNTRSFPWRGTLGSQSSERRQSESGPPGEWRLESASDPAGMIDREKLIIRLVIPVKEQPISCPLLVNSLAKSRLEVVLPDGSTRAVHAKIDMQKAKQYIYWNSIYERLDPSVLKEEGAENKEMMSWILLNMRPGELLALQSGEHTFTWVSGKHKSNELKLQIR